MTTSEVLHAVLCVSNQIDIIMSVFLYIVNEKDGSKIFKTITILNIPVLYIGAGYKII